MACYGAYAQKAMLDWLFLGAVPARPTVNGIGLSLGAPTSLSMSEVGTASGYTAQTGSFAAAASPAGSVSNAGAHTFGPFSSAQAISGLIVKDTLATAGNMLAYGNLATARTVAIGDSLVIAAGALSISLA
jgi:hypothetical protein